MYKSLYAEEIVKGKRTKNETGKRKENRDIDKGTSFMGI